MSRIVLEKERQREFLNKVHDKSGLGWDSIAEICHVCGRTVRDWRREKYNMNYETLLKLHEQFQITTPKIIKILPEFWSTKKAAKLGAIRRNKLYGNPGTPEGRRKGGLAAMEKFHADPSYAKKIGIKMRRKIKIPANSPKLSEFIGILLGDGGMTPYQVAITVNSETDRDYATYIGNFIKELFDIMPKIKLRNNRNEKTCDIIMSSKNLIEFLTKKGLKVGHKINNKIDIPVWIKAKRQYKIACLRGLMDTDGSFYNYKHKVNGKLYNNFGICFTNYSEALLSSAYNILKELGFSPSRSNARVFLCKKRDIKKYIDMIGSNNPKHTAKYDKYIIERYVRDNNRMALKTA